MFLPTVNGRESTCLGSRVPLVMSSTKFASPRITLAPLVSASFFIAAGLPARKLVGAIASTNSDVTKRARSVFRASMPAPSTQWSRVLPSARYDCSSRLNKALSLHAESAKRRSPCAGTRVERPATMPAYSPRSFAYSPDSILGWRASWPSNLVAAASTSLLRTPISGLTASAFCAAPSIRASCDASRPARGVPLLVRDPAVAFVARRLVRARGVEGGVLAALLTRRNAVLVVATTPPPSPLSAAPRCQQCQRFRDQRRFGLPLDLDGVLHGNESASLGPALDGKQYNPVAHPRTRLDWSDKAHFVETVVERCRGIRRNHANLHRQRSRERQRQIAMRDGSAERTLVPRPFDVDMDPLSIAGAIGELVDAVLIDSGPVGDPELLLRELLERSHAVSGHCHAHLFRRRCRDLSRACRRRCRPAPRARGS